MLIIIKRKGNRLVKANDEFVFSLHQPVSFTFNDNLHYFCSYVTLRDGPAGGKNMCFRLTLDL